jgi:hypothetical protein
MHCNVNKHQVQSSGHFSGLEREKDGEQVGIGSLNWSCFLFYPLMTGNGYSGSDYYFYFYFIFELAYINNMRRFHS